MCGERVFLVHSRCSNCDQMSTRRVPIPAEADDGPQDVDEFLESAALANLPFSCRRCESSIAVLVAVTMERPLVPMGV